MSPFSGLVLGSTALMSTPAALMLYQGTMSVTEAVERSVIVAVICWAALSFVEAFAFPSPAARRLAEPDQPAALTQHSADAAE